MLVALLAEADLMFNAPLFQVTFTLSMNKFKLRVR